MKKPILSEGMKVALQIVFVCFLSLNLLFGSIWFWSDVMGVK